MQLKKKGKAKQPSCFFNFRSFYFFQQIFEKKWEKTRSWKIPSCTIQNRFHFHRELNQQWWKSERDGKRGANSHMGHKAMRFRFITFTTTTRRSRKPFFMVHPRKDWIWFFSLHLSRYSQLPFNPIFFFRPFL